jgi:hypothetical protein
MQQRDHVLYLQLAATLHALQNHACVF